MLRGGCGGISPPPGASGPSPDELRREGCTSSASALTRVGFTDLLPPQATYLDASSQDCHRVAALTFALPHSFFLWATGLTVAQAVVWFERTVSEHVPLEREVTMCILAAIALSIILAACVPWRRWGAAVARATHLPWWRKGRSGVEHASSEFCEKV